MTKDTDGAWPPISFSADRELFRRRLVEQNRRDSAPVIHGLHQLGYDVTWIEDLFHEPYAYKDAIPLLLNWLPRVSNESVKEAIVRALSVKWARPIAARPLLAELPTAQKFQLKWAITNALFVVADDSVLDDVLDLLEDRNLGDMREMLVAALGNMKEPRAADTALAFLRRGEFPGYAAMALGRLKDQRARPFLKDLLGDSDEWVRRQARSALAKLDRAEKASATRRQRRP